MRGRVMATVAAAALVAMTTVPASAQEQLIKVYVFTAGSTGGFVDAALTARQQQVTDLKASLVTRKFVKSSPLAPKTLVEDRSQADVSIEVLERGPLPVGTRISLPQMCPCWDFHARLTVNAEYSIDFHEAASNSFQPLCAEYLAQQIDKWIDQNKGRLLELRKQKK